MIYIKTQNDIEKIKIAGLISKKVMLDAISFVKTGITTLELNDYIEQKILSYDAKTWFKEVGKYPYATCISVNDAWLHGMPNNSKLKYGDKVSIDIGIKKDNYYVDNCWSVVVEDQPVSYTSLPTKYQHNQKEVSRFLEVGVLALKAAIECISDGVRIGTVSSVMQRLIEAEGYSVIREYTGHGVGIKPHEDPAIPCYGKDGQGVLLKKGMVLAVEVMYTMKSPIISTDSDGWTIRSKDGGLTGMFEHTVLVKQNGVELLTD